MFHERPDHGMTVLGVERVRFAGHWSTTAASTGISEPHLKQLLSFFIR
jgi:hypothetical protein